MNAQPESPDDPVARLRAADPAADSTPDTVALRAAVRDRGESQRPDGADQDELATARARRWTARPARAASAAAVALVVAGAGGYAIGATTGSQDDGARAAITLSGGAERSAADGLALQPEQALPGAGEDAAGPVPAPRELSGADIAYWPGHGGRTVFTSSGLGTSGGSAQAWAFDAQAVFSEQTAAAAADALGVEGGPRLAHGSWMVGPDDGSGPNVQLHADGTSSLSFYDPTNDPWACDVVGGAADADPGTADAPEASEQGRALAREQEEAGMLPTPQDCGDRDLGEAPKGGAAEERLADLLDALGQDPDDFEVTAEEQGDPKWTHVTAHQVVDGQRTGIQWSASLTGAGVQSLHGSLAPLVPMGEYEVVSPTEAVERLTDPRFGAGLGGPIAYLEGAGPRSDGGSATSAMPVEPSERSAPPGVAEGAEIRWPVRQVEIVEARLGAALHTQQDGASILVPSYELISDDGGIWSTIAVTENHLDLDPER